MDCHQTAGLVVTERQTVLDPLPKSGRVQHSGLVQKFSDSETHAVDGVEHLHFNLVEP